MTVTAFNSPRVFTACCLCMVSAADNVLFAQWQQAAAQVDDRGKESFVQISGLAHLVTQALPTLAQDIEDRSGVQMQQERT